MSFLPIAPRLLALFCVAALAACDDGGGAICTDPEPTDEELLPGCTVPVAWDEEAVEYCAVVTLDNGACPAVGSPQTQDLGRLRDDPADPEDTSAEIVCGPKHATPATSMNGSGECCYVGLVRDMDAVSDCVE